jgi:UDP-N-acetylmuramoylalanine--D-glutamate ligase
LAACGLAWSYKLLKPLSELSPFLTEENSKITVVGAGKSGLAAAKILKNTYNVFISESKNITDKRTLSALKTLKVPYEINGHTNKALSGTGLIIISPGVPLDIPILIEAKRRLIPIISEIELAYQILRKPIIAVTGTNGKTTTTTLIGEMLRDHGYKVAVAGNIGEPLVLVNDKKLDYIVAEISSYQLEAIKDFKPWISLLLNITEDHLTRHKNMAGYTKAKARIFMNQNKNDHLIFNVDDKSVTKISKLAKCKKIAFSRRKQLSSGISVKNGMISFDGQQICATKDIKIKGDHNIENALAASAAAMICKVPPTSIKKTLQRFRGVEHRIEFVTRKKGVSFFNDSKGTNPDSTIVAIKALKRERGIVLILGGRDKLTDLKQMCATIKKDVKNVVLVGEAKERFRKNLIKCGYKNIKETETFKDAVNNAYSIAKAGDAVLLSPACASFDMFNNYEERGRVFKEIVAGL